VPIKMNYRSIMKIAQEAAETASMERTFQIAGSLSSAAQAAGVPDPVRIIDLDKALREYGRLTNFPVNTFFSTEQVQQIDEQKQQQNQQQQAAQATLPAVQAANTLSKTDVGNGQSALQTILGG
jgi:multidrug resistance efflux pump